MLSKSLFLGFERSSLSLFTGFPMSSSSKITAEYAKSGRSSCKKCSKPIPKDTVRLGSVTKGPQGFDMTKWHHFNCLPFKSVETISGFSSLNPTDQESLKNFAQEAENKEKTPQKARKAEEIDGETKEKDPKKRKAEEIQEEGVVEVEIEFSESKVNNDYKGVVLKPKWKAFKTVIFLEREEGLKDSSKIAAFDFDGCLAKTDVRKPGAKAWSLMYDCIPEKLKELYAGGYKVVIFTNEANIERWKNKREAAIESKIGRLESFIERVGIPVQVFVACGHGGEDGFRKPKVGMWRLMEKWFNGGVEIDMGESFYVGDAAGREEDHGDADVKFAEKIGLKFYVPEDYFEV